MRTLGFLAAGATAFVIVAACGSDGGGGGAAPADDSGSTTVTADYCTKYCAAQASSGTLTGSRAECLANCCKNVSGGCPATTDPDAGGDLGPVDAGGADACVTCGDTCCGAGKGCLTDANGKPACVATCTTGKDCASGCCAPATDKSGNPVGPYVCKPDDKENYDCCTAFFGSCNTGYCCISDTNGNEFCAKPCSANSECTGARCTGGSAGVSCFRDKLFCQP